MIPRRHVSGVLAAARRELFSKSSGLSEPAYAASTAVAAIDLVGSVHWPVGGVIVYTPPMMIAQSSVFTAR